MLTLPGVIESDRDRDEAIRKVKDLALKDMVLRAKFGLEPMTALLEDLLQPRCLKGPRSSYMTLSARRSGGHDRCLLGPARSLTTAAIQLRQPSLEGDGGSGQRLRDWAPFLRLFSDGLKASRVQAWHHRFGA